MSQQRRNPPGSAGLGNATARALLRPGEPLGLGLTDYAESLASRLTLQAYGEVSDTDWLQKRYAEIVPLVLVDALEAVERGEPMPETTLAAVRRHAAACSEPVSPGTVFRGALPALRVFGEVLHLTIRADPTKAFVAMARASAVAGELGSSWAEGWDEVRHPEDVGTAGSVLTGAPGAGEVGSTIVAVDIAGPDAQMLLLAAGGSSNAEIAEETHYSRQAVTWRLSRLMKRWNARNRAALVANGFSRGVLEVHEEPPSPGADPGAPR